MPRIVGLTGGIASGKSTVAEILSELGAPIVDADQIARDVVEPGTPALADIVARWGEGVLDADGRLDRKKLGDIIFSDPDQRRALEAITHPRIASASQQAIARHIGSSAAVIIYEAALIVENRLHQTGWMAQLIVVSVSRELQRSRLMARDGIDEAAADARLDAQLPLADKVSVADFVIDNSGSIEETRLQVAALWSKLTGSTS